MIDALIDGVIAKEGGFSDHPADRGGPTRYGVTQEVARAYGYGGAMAQFPRSEAVRIYKLRYWLRPGFDRVADIYPAVAAEMFDTGINMGVKAAGTLLQRALNVLNREGRDYGDLKPDGDCGPMTIQNLAAFKACRGADGGKVLLTALNCMQGSRYIGIAEARPSQEVFVYGWLANRVEL
jgi:lysozyme family protein